MLYQTVATEVDRQRFTPEGSLVDVGGYTLHLHCTGRGSPTVVLEAGAGAPSPIWGWVQPAVAEQTRVCSYDRAGLGWSDAGPDPRDAASIARELHTLLLRAGETGPFVLAGHSLGGQYALMFAELYAEDTAGLVLIEAQHPDTLFRTPEAQDAARAQQHQVNLFVVLSHLGIVRLFSMAPADQRLPAASQAALNQAVDRTDLVTALRDEQLAVPTNREQLQVGGALGSLPVRVVSATEHGMEPELRVVHPRPSTCSWPRSRPTAARTSRPALITCRSSRIRPMPSTRSPRSATCSIWCTTSSRTSASAPFKPDPSDV